MARGKKQRRSLTFPCRQVAWGLGNLGMGPCGVAAAGYYHSVESHPCLSDDVPAIIPGTGQYSARIPTELGSIMTFSSAITVDAKPAPMTQVSAFISSIS